MKRQPVFSELQDQLQPFEVFKLFKDDAHSFFLDSGMDPQRLGRYSFIGSDPFLIVQSYGDRITLVSNGKRETIVGDPFVILHDLLNKYHLDGSQVPVPFCGGGVGYLSYDLCHFIERLPLTTSNDLQLPECYIAFYSTILAFDNLKSKSYAVSSGFPECENEELRLKRAAQQQKEMKVRLSNPVPCLDDNTVKNPTSTEKIYKCNFSPEDYKAAVARVREYIIAGDIYQANISQRFETDLVFSSCELYRRLRQINPAPFATYLNFDDVVIVSASPERFLRLDAGQVETRPIKGTRPRSTNAHEDRKMAQELTESSKDRAENIMIVDLARNDLGRVCQFGSVQVSELAILETFPDVFHLTSTVKGRLRPDKSRLDLLKAVFPGGSITGAPKVRAMEIIDEVEPTRRSVYTGAIGYFCFSGNIDLNIVIRTFIIKDKKVYFQVGGGIVYDSDPEKEYEETLHKARALMQALGLKCREE